eukprot:TRINITY_DN16920_c0_g2_i1.p1 TRINITY_DN16920_c0_g2~~TRINITY_DN16920_c0_g2_i1.p1  ORF type:complete len:154 (+),score=26.34 TRINITY_DN16920_c0_g2_i1:42-503(+)
MAPAEHAFVLPRRPKPTAPYPDVRRAGGLLYVAGASSREPGTGSADSGHFVGVATDADGRTVYDVEAQTCRVIQALRDALGLVGHALDDLVKVNCYLVDLADMPAFGRAYARFFDAKTGPVRTTVVVKNLPHKDIRVEIEGVALDRAVHAPKL